MTDSPIPMRLCCEGCGKLRIDEGEFATKPHHTHSCQHCGLTWRPSVVHTVGVQFLPGFKNDSGPTALTAEERKERGALGAYAGQLRIRCFISGEQVNIVVAGKEKLESVRERALASRQGAGASGDFAAKHEIRNAFGVWLDPGLNVQDILWADRDNPTLYINLPVGSGG